MARPRDLCDVKIKIVEVVPGSGGGADAHGGAAEGYAADQTQQGWQGRQGGQTAARNLRLPQNRSGEKRYEISRVSASDENGMVHGVLGGHRHTLEESDQVKKNSVIRQSLAVEKEMRNQTVSLSLIPPFRIFGYISLVR